MSYRKGENLSCCPVCGKQYYAGDFRLRWDGLFVCRYDYEERHPQDFVRGKADNMQPAVVAGCCGADGAPQLATSDAPLCPFPLEPLDNAVIGNTTSVNLSFTTFPGISSYQIYFWEDGESQPATPIYTTTGSPYFVTGLSEDTGYNWFVTASNDDGEFRDCSGNARFFTTALAIPACPLLVSPADGASLEGDSVTLEWNASSGASSYLVYVAEDGGPLTLLTETVETSYEITGLTLGVSFTWLVRASNEAGTSAGCGGRSFETTSTVTLSASSYVVYDNEGSAVITILRTGDDGAATVDYATADDTAVAPGDYTETTGTATWADGESESIPVSIPISVLSTITELESDVLYPWITGAVADPRNSQNDHIYRAMGAADPAADPGITPVERATLSLATLDFETAWEADFPSIEVQDLLLVGHRPELWNQNSRGVLSSQFGPLNTVAEHEKIIVTIHCNEQSPQGYDDFVASGAGTEIAYYVNSNYTLNNAPHRSNSNRPLGVWYYGDLDNSAPENASFPSVLTNRPIATEVDTNFASGGNEVHYTQDALIECERVPVGPPIPGSDLPDWPIDPVNFWWNSGTGQLFSKQPWTRVDGAYRWLSLYAEGATDVTRYPQSPVLLQGDPSDTEAFWTAAYDAAVLAGDLPAGMTYDAAGTGGVTTYPRNQTYAWRRQYKLPLQFNVNLSNASGAELIEPDSAIVYILPGG